MSSPTFNPNTTQQHSSNAQATTSKRWKNAQLDPTFRKSPNPSEFHPQHTQSQPMHPSNIPQTVDVSFGAAHQNQPYANYAPHDPTGLPWLNHDAALKHAKVQFTGLGDMFVFYNQLLNALDQFGVFLTPLKQIVYKQNLGPTQYNGIQISKKDTNKWPAPYTKNCKNLMSFLWTILPSETSLIGFLKTTMAILSYTQCWSLYTLYIKRMPSSYHPNLLTVMRTSIYMPRNLKVG
jgi:hypothetical protein